MEKKKEKEKKKFSLWVKTQVIGPFEAAAQKKKKINEDEVDNQEYVKEAQTIRTNRRFPEGKGDMAGEK